MKALTGIRPLAKVTYRLINKALQTVGLRLVRWRNACEFPQVIELLKAKGFYPSTVFDIGVAYGTPDLYYGFNQAKFHLIDPLPQSLPYMKSWAATISADIHNVAIGEIEKNLEIEVREDIGKSTFFRELGNNTLSISRIIVPVKRFDKIFSGSDVSDKTLAKIDVQGAELQVLRSMGNLLESIDVFIIEVSSIVTLDGGAAHMFEVIDFLRPRGYTIFDICGIGRRSLDNAMAQLDLVFIKQDSELLKDRRWSQ